MVDIQQATLIDMAITVAVGRTEEGSGGLGWRSDCRSPGRDHRRRGRIPRVAWRCTMVPNMRRPTELRRLQPESNQPAQRYRTGPIAQPGFAPVTGVGRVSMPGFASDARGRVAAAQELLEAHLPRYVGGAGRCAVCGVPGPCGPYEIAMAVFAGLGTLPRRPPFASQVGGQSAPVRIPRLVRSVAGAR